MKSEKTSRLEKELWMAVIVFAIIIVVNIVLTYFFGGSYVKDTARVMVIYIGYRIGYNMGYNECYQSRYELGIEHGMRDLIFRTKMYFLEIGHKELFNNFMEYILKSTEKYDVTHFEETDEIIADKMEEHLNPET